MNGGVIVDCLTCPSLPIHLRQSHPPPIQTLIHLDCQPHLVLVLQALVPPLIRRPPTSLPFPPSPLFSNRNGYTQPLLPTESSLCNTEFFSPRHLSLLRVKAPLVMHMMEHHAGRKAVRDVLRKACSPPPPEVHRIRIPMYIWMCSRYPPPEVLSIDRELFTCKALSTASAPPPPARIPHSPPLHLLNLCSSVLWVPSGRGGRLGQGSGRPVSDRPPLDQPARAKPHLHPVHHRQQYHHRCTSQA